MSVKIAKAKVTDRMQMETQVELSGMNVRFKRKLKSDRKLKNLNESNGC